mmetsp:Transcript_2543/g.5790  ORF Transcript_2543/g.5790 Transcript_2543/m.5790 type:complete len:117 (+) Transcript_2543:1130-1480(+)
MQNHKCLSELHLCGNSIGDPGAVALAKMLQCKNPSNLKMLDLRSNLGDDFMTEKGRKAIGCAMRRNRAMKQLLFPIRFLDCPCYQCAQFCALCNSIAFLNVMQAENNVMIPWHKAI